MDPQLFALATDIPLDRAEKVAPHFAAAMQRWGIHTPEDQAAIIAQCAIESADFTRKRENMIYSTARAMRGAWPYRFRSDADCKPYLREPEKLANYVYANRNGNGDQHSGDGWLYIGRSWIQITGKNNYRACGLALELDLLTNPALLELPEHAAQAAGWYWHENGLSRWIARGNFGATSGIINCGDPDKIAHKHDEREEKWHSVLYWLNKAAGE